MNGVVYKILRETEWAQTRECGVFHGSPDDLRDGFLHFSAAHQVRETVHKYFSTEDRLMLLALDAEKMGPSLRWEISRGGEKFPHFYGVLACDRVLHAEILRRDKTGNFVFSADIP
jgi:uncharacterized protein (DUF952 family)